LEENAERIFGPKIEVIGNWRKLRKEELHKLYSLPYIIRMMKSRRMRWSGHVARMDEKRNAYRIWLENHKKTLLGRTRRRWEDNIEVELREIEWGDME
jgi:hypothetical protein